MPATYDPAGVIFTCFGVPIPSGGFADGTFISAERAEDGWTTTVGAGGEVMRTRNNNRSGMVTLTLLQSSLGNDLLTAIAILDELTGAGVGPLLVKDLSGITTLASEQAWIKKWPTIAFAKEKSDREWPIECAALLPVLGGVLA